MSIKIPVSAELNQQDMAQQIKQMESALNELGRVAETAGKIKFTPVSNVSLDAAKKMRAEFDAMVRMSPGLKRVLETGGQGGKKFDNVDWGKVWSDPNQRAAHAATMLRRLRPASAEVLTPLPPVPAGEAGASGDSSTASGRRRRRPRSDASAVGDDGDDRTPSTGGRWKRVLAGGAAGIAGGVASQIGGMGGGIASGALAGGLAGGPIGAAVGGLAGAITSLLGAVGEARDIAINLDTLKRTLGDTDVSFTKLRDTTRGLADEFSLSDTEANGLTKQYANLSGHDKNLPGLRDEVGVGVGFSRSFGMDPSAGVGFFGQMRGMGITKNADDNKRLALMIGESVAKAGELPRMGDVLAGLSRYMESTTGHTLGAANGEAWLSKLAGLSQSGLPGVNPGTASNIIAKADNAISQGGITEAGKNWMSGALQKELGLNPIQANSQLEGGLFASGKSTFGEGTAIGRYNSRHGVEAPAAATSTRTNVEILMASLEKQYAGRSDLMLDAMKNQFGMSSGQAAAWQTAGAVKVSGMVGRLNRLGLNPSQVNSTGISQLSQIEADGKLTDAQKDAAAKDTASRNQEDTIGSEARQASMSGSNAMVRLASEGLPMISSIQAGVLKLAGIDPMAPQKAILAEEHKKRSEAIDAKEGKERDAAAKDYTESTPWYKRVSGRGLTDDQQQAKERYEAARDDVISARDAEDKRYQKAQTDLGTGVPLKTSATSSSAPAAAADAVPAGGSAPGEGATSARPARPGGIGGGPVAGATPEILRRAAQSDALHGLPEGTTAGLISQESSFNSSATSRAGAEGLFQIMPKNTKEYSRRKGRQMDPRDTDDAFYMYDQLMGERKLKYGGDTDKMLKSYNAGYKEERWNNAETADYVPAIERRKREMEAARREQAISVNVHQTGEFILRDTGGAQVAVAEIQTNVGKPIASGMGR